MLETFKIVGSLLGILAFGWKVWDFFATYLHIGLTVDVDDGRTISAKTIVDNKGSRSKKIDNALLLIGPESESPIETFNQLFKSIGNERKVISTNEIAETKLEEQCSDNNGRAIIPLSFYYSENVSVGDEQLSYRAPINSDGIEAGKTYSVRFFVYGEGRLHRSTHDSFSIQIG